MQKVAPTLLVEKIEPSLKFWTEELGFTKEMEVPSEQGPVFVMLTNGPVEVHLQTLASASKEIPILKNCKMPAASFLYIDVPDVHALYDKLRRFEIVVPLEKTFYGATHFFLREPGGHILGFSQNLN
jgi:uncharacterized glyoxalase superfamily protein PhnB